MVTVEAIPYSSFKERIRLTKELTKAARPLKIEVYPTFIYVEGETNDRGVQGTFKQHRTA